ncbi:hypothetical protein GF324_00605 [bacterium]|nr:hypothetical protein [bacterium]
MKRALLTGMVLLTAFGLTAQTSQQRWQVIRDGFEAGTSPVQTHRDVTFIDALSVCDAVGVVYTRDDEGRFIFSFPEHPVTFVPDGPFAQTGLDFIHFTLPPYYENYRLFVPQRHFIEILEQFYPGRIHIEPALRRIEVVPPASDVIAARGRMQQERMLFEVVLRQPLAVKIELVDSMTIDLQVQGIERFQAPMFEADSSFGGSMQWRPGETLHAYLKTPFPIGDARLSGPTYGGVVTVILTPREEDNGPGGTVEVLQALEQDKRAWEIDKIVVDAGHGGKDPGAIGHNHTREKEIALDIALRLRDQIRERARVEVVMTRDTDVFIPLNERTRIANSTGGKLFISIHCNSARSRRAHGQETYFLSPARNERAMKVAMKENSVIKYEESQEEYTDLTEENFILLAMAQAQFVKESEDFAGMIQRRMTSRSGLHDRGVDQAGFYVLIGASMPAVLVETAFLSNAKEESLLRKPSFRQDTAEGICDAVIDFMEKYGE